MGNSMINGNVFMYRTYQSLIAVYNSSILLGKIGRQH